MGQRCDRYFFKEDIKMVTDIRKSAPHHQSLGICKLKLQWCIVSHLLGCLSSKRQEIASIPEHIDKGVPLCIVGRNIIGAVSAENSREVSKKIKIELSYDPNFHYFVYIQRLRRGSQRDICTPMYTASLFTIGKIWKPKCPPKNEWLKAKCVCTYSTYTQWNFIQWWERWYCHAQQLRNPFIVYMHQIITIYTLNIL